MNDFWRGRRVLLTGHTGFKGAWTALWLERLGARVTGYALAPPMDRDCVFTCAGPWATRSLIGDLCDADAVARAVEQTDPEIILHMAAQALVRRSYADPVETFQTNVMGTVHLLSAAAKARSLRCILVVTSDKVYDDNHSGRAFGEDDPLAGDDPYSASKAATELVVRSWRKSFLRGRESPALAVARAGNVIGGGDWAEDRLVADVLRAGVARQPVVLRYPEATRPWQHVLDVISGYLTFTEHLTMHPDRTPRVLNFGPDPCAAAICTYEIVEWLQAGFGWNHGWVLDPHEPLPERVRLSLDASLAAATLSWRPKLDSEHSLNWIVQWHRAHQDQCNMREVSLGQIEQFEALPMPGNRQVAAQ